MKELKEKTLQAASAKADMDVKTARKYRDAGKLPSELKEPHIWRNRPDPFADNWDEIEKMLEQEPGLQAKTVFEHFQSKLSEPYKAGQLRTLQRRFKHWRAHHGKNKPVMFSQIHEPGEQSQSDYTDMSKLSVSINGESFIHLIFHFMLVYSRWEYVEICYTESFDSLASGVENAFWQMGFVAQEHRTDNLSAATKKFKSKRAFTERWEKVMDHYNVRPSRNNPGESHENGSIEKSNDLFKNAVDQQLMLRGSRDFDSIDAYKQFLKQLAKRRNQPRMEYFNREVKFLKALPGDRWYSPKQHLVRVSPSSTVQILGVPYSVPSRLISLTLKALIYPDKIHLFYGQRQVQAMPRIFEGNHINYRHIIDSLIRKPGAFKHYQYRESLFPNTSFRQAYDLLIKANQAVGHKHYLKLLYLAKQHGEQAVNIAIELLMESKALPFEKDVKALLDLPVNVPAVRIDEPNLAAYDQLRLSGICMGATT